MSPSFKRRFNLLVAPSKTTTFNHVQQPYAVVFVSDPYRQTETPEVVLRDLFGLSKAEAKVAARLAQGRENEQICDELKLSTNTI